MPDQMPEMSMMYIRLLPQQVTKGLGDVGRSYATVSHLHVRTCKSATRLKDTLEEWVCGVLEIGRESRAHTHTHVHK